MQIINKEELHNIFTKLKIEKQDSVFNELYNKYSELVYNIAYSLIKNRENCEEIKQTVFLKIWQIERKNLPSKNEASWLYTVTKNETLNYIKKLYNTINLDEIYYINNEDKELNEIIDKDSYNRLIAKLNKEEQEIVSLKILTNLSFKEIAQILNEPVGTIKWRYYRAIHTLKILLSNLGMFIVAFVMGTKILFNQNKSNREEEIVEDNKTNQSQENLESETVKSETQENFRYEDYADNTKQNETNQETIIVNNTAAENHTNYLGVGLFSLSAIFLVLTIIFAIIFIKYQLKAKKKVSK